MGSPKGQSANCYSVYEGYVRLDGRLIGLITPGQAAGAEGAGPSEVRIFEHWTEELKRLVPVK